jgi:pantothenate kinase
MEDPKEAHARRGAPWTFDPALLLNCLKKLKNEGSVYVPSFDHGVGDPVEDDIFVSLQ